MDDSVIRMISGNKSNCTLVNEQDLRSARPASFTALISGVDGVFSLYTSLVEFIGKFEGYWSFNVLLNDHEMFRYVNLVEVATDYPKGQWIDDGIRIGTAGKAYPLGFEYCTQWRGESNYPVRICGRTYYRQNPLEVLEGIYIPPRGVDVVETYTPLASNYEFDDDELKEWGLLALAEEIPLEKSPLWALIDPEIYGPDSEDSVQPGED